MVKQQTFEIGEAVNVHCNMTIRGKSFSSQTGTVIDAAYCREDDEYRYSVAVDNGEIVVLPEKNFSKCSFSELEII